MISPIAVCPLAQLVVRRRRRLVTRHSSLINPLPNSRPSRNSIVFSSATAYTSTRRFPRCGPSAQRTQLHIFARHHGRRLPLSPLFESRRNRRTQFSSNSRDRSWTTRTPSTSLRVLLTCACGHLGWGSRKSPFSIQLVNLAGVSCATTKRSHATCDATLLDMRRFITPLYP